MISSVQISVCLISLGFYRVFARVNGTKLVLAQDLVGLWIKFFLTLALLNNESIVGQVQTIFQIIIISLVI